MIESLHFYYDGLYSNSMKVMQISTGSGLFEEPFIAPKQLNEQKIRGKDSPYLFGVEREPISFPIRLWFEPGLTDAEIRSIARWLDQDYYKEFYFEDSPHRIMYGMFIGDSKYIHNGIREGFLQLEFRTNSPYAHMPVVTSSVFDYSLNVVGGTELVFDNQGDIACKPILYITKATDNGTVRIVNKTKSNEEFSLSNLTLGEKVTVDNELETIETDAIGVYHYSNHNGTFLDIPIGVNNLQVYGNCTLQLKYQFKIKPMQQ